MPRLRGSFQGHTCGIGASGGGRERARCSPAARRPPFPSYQPEDRVEQLFHEKAMTASAAWNRHFDAMIANLRFKVGGKSLAIEPTLNLLQDRAGAKRKAAAEALAHTFKTHIQAFVLTTNTLAKDKEI